VPSKEPGYVRMNITVPRELRARMMRVSGINWSKVAAAAFRAEAEKSVPPRPGEKKAYTKYGLRAAG
jgi:post-segregation antitoxin (ccd killing protein)